MKFNLIRVIGLLGFSLVSRWSVVRGEGESAGADQVWLVDVSLESLQQV